MSSSRPCTRDRILRSAYRLFYREGFSRVSVDAIADEARLTKRTVYYHFKSKDDIAAAALEDLHRHMMPQMRAWIGEETDNAPDMMTALFDALKTWADRDPWLGSGFSRIAAELADLPGHPARQSARTHKASVEGWLCERFATAGVEEPAELGRQIMLLIEGSMSLSLIHGNTEYIRSAGAAARNLVAKSGR